MVMGGESASVRYVFAEYPRQTEFLDYSFELTILLKKYKEVFNSHDK
jgi:hypothetical protein